MVVMIATLSHYPLLYSFYATLTTYSNMYKLILINLNKQSIVIL